MPQWLDEPEATIYTLLPVKGVKTDEKSGKKEKFFSRLVR